MSSKDLAVEIVRRLPEEASLMEIAREIEFVAGIHEAIDQFDHGDTLTAEDLLREIPQWAGTKNSK